MSPTGNGLADYRGKHKLSSADAGFDSPRRGTEALDIDSQLHSFHSGPAGTGTLEAQGYNPVEIKLPIRAHSAVGPADILIPSVPPNPTSLCNSVAGGRGEGRGRERV